MYFFLVTNHDRIDMGRARWCGDEPINQGYISYILWLVSLFLESSDDAGDANLMPS